MASGSHTAPDWPALYDLANAQGGLFRTDQAAAVGFSPQLLRSHVLAGRLERVRRGIYRVAHLPTVANEDLVELWLWSNELGVYSHETAFALHGLSDALPARIHITLPLSWKRRRLTMPTILIPHYGDVPPCDRSWIGLVPVTTPMRTLRDVIDDHGDPDMIDQAIADGLTHGVFRREDVLRAVPIRRMR